ncbi:hypothetical protein ES731_15275 [Psychroflexus gondwanensis]|uniref:hypothetical protein n=1 Tax=Psychroflexus gondwanensis TaxID=251 RepID=UPI0011BF95B0|nr:hypothetical protein [Psychroflexus gondwanensis]TXE15544.1 hypothetical protein ES731_15275 [Psychroflexus gondwanensis]
MKKTFSILTIFFALNLFGQNLTDKVGEIEVELISHSFKRNSDDELTKRKTNNRNRPSVKMYFQSNSNLLKSINYGKHHNTDLRRLNEISIFKFDENGNKIREDIWGTDYQKNLSHKYYRVFNFNDNKKLISEKLYDKTTDTLFTKTDYWYNIKGEYQGVRFDSTYYYQRKYNQDKKLISLSQIYDGKLRWDWKYNYVDNIRIGIFQTYYNDGKDYSKKEIKTYDKKGRLIEIKELQITNDGLEERTNINYDRHGIIKRIEEYESYNREDGFELVSYLDIKVKSKVMIDTLIAERINEQIRTE